MLPFVLDFLLFSKQIRNSSARVYYVNNHRWVLQMYSINVSKPSLLAHWTEKEFRKGLHTHKGPIWHSFCLLHYCQKRPSNDQYNIAFASFFICNQSLYIPESQLNYIYLNTESSIFKFQYLITLIDIF